MSAELLTAEAEPDLLLTERRCWLRTGMGVGEAMSAAAAPLPAKNIGSTKPAPEPPPVEADSDCCREVDSWRPDPWEWDSAGCEGSCWLDWRESVPAI